MTGERQVLTGADERDPEERATLESRLAEGFQALAVGPGSALGRAVQEKARGHNESLADKVTWSLDTFRRRKGNYKDATLP